MPGGVVGNRAVSLGGPFGEKCWFSEAYSRKNTGEERDGAAGKARRFFLRELASGSSSFRAERLQAEEWQSAAEVRRTGGYIRKQGCPAAEEKAVLKTVKQARKPNRLPGLLQCGKIPLRISGR